MRPSPIASTYASSLTLSDNDFARERPVSRCINSIRSVLQSPLRLAQNQIDRRAYSLMRARFSSPQVSYTRAPCISRTRRDDDLITILSEGAQHQRQSDNLSWSTIPGMAPNALYRQPRHSTPDKSMLLLGLLALGTTAGAGGLWYTWHQHAAPSLPTFAPEPQQDSSITQAPIGNPCDFNATQAYSSPLPDNSSSSLTTS
jgi:hypothetical protein